MSDWTVTALSGPCNVSLIQKLASCIITETIRDIILCALTDKRYRCYTGSWSDVLWNQVSFRFLVLVEIHA